MFIENNGIDKIKIIAPNDANHPSFTADVFKTTTGDFGFEILEQTIDGYLIKGVKKETASFHGAYVVADKELFYKISISKGSYIDTITVLVTQLELSAHCYNNIKDDDENGVDCGGSCDDCGESCDDCVSLKMDTISSFENPIIKVDFLNELNGIICENSVLGNKLKLTEDGGLTWTEINNPDLSSINHIRILDENTFVVFHSDFANTYSISTDKGGTWNNSTERFNEIKKHNLGFIGAGTNRVKFSSDGVNWENEVIIDDVFPTYSMASVHLNMFFVDSELGFLILEHKDSEYYLYKTTDSGFSWDSISNILINSSNEINDFYFTDESNGYMVGDFKEILSTSDGGITWDIRFSSSDYTYNTIHFYNDKALALGVYACKSINVGSSWNELMNANNTQPELFYFSDSYSVFDRYMYTLVSNGTSNGNNYVFKIDMEDL